jgi:hypothetical protein
MEEYRAILRSMVLDSKKIGEVSESSFIIEAVLRFMTLSSKIRGSIDNRRL